MVCFGCWPIPNAFCYSGCRHGCNQSVGLEDSLWIGKGELAKSNAEQVTKIRTIIESLGHNVATPDEARSRLALKGKDDVRF